MDRNAPSARTARLTKTFTSILHGQVNMAPHLGPLFLEAMYSQQDPVACAGKLVASSSGLSALQTAIRYDLSPKFLNTHATAVLEFLQTPDLKPINNGQFLTDIIIKIVDPPMFWMAFRGAFMKGELGESATISFGWLLLQLCSLPIDQATPYRQDVDMTSILASLATSSSPKIVVLGTKITEILTVAAPVTMAPSGGVGPGGRHDNDFADFRMISILPTSGELSSTDPPFLRPSSVLEDPETESNRVAIHLDNQFRLLREDMLYEMREELDVALGRKKGHHKGVKIDGLSVESIDLGPLGKRTKWGLVCACKEDLPQLKGLEEKERRKYFDEKKNFFKHQSLACLLAGKEILAFPTINRDEARLAKNPPEIVLQFENTEGTRFALRKLKKEHDIKLIQIDTAVFAYEPVLKGLQQAINLPLSSELLLWKKGDVLEEIPIANQATIAVNALRADAHTNLKPLLRTSTDIRLDASQARSLLSGLTQKVSLIQGPPGTGKSFIGALIAKAIHDFTDQTMLVVCYTNHALDDILESLLDIGIPEASMLRMGGKSTAKTEPLKLPRTQGSARNWSVINELKGQLENLSRGVDSAFNRYTYSKYPLTDVLDYLEVEEPQYFKAFCVPELEDGMQIVGANSKAIGPDYLLDKWAKDQDPGPFAQDVMDSNSDIWMMPLEDRKGHLQRWNDALLEESIQELSINANEYARCQQRLQSEFSSDTASVLRSKRIVGCTTTAAAKYREEIQTFNPNILLVEEAGEILESHVLTSIGPETSQMILIGDHKQLRPKVNHYLLTVEKGAGFDLNCSLFERLILKDYPHESLSEQHRMRPEISALIRHLTYPELRDAPKTANRPNLLGVQDNIVFIHHENPEDDNKQLADRRDMASTSSKQNSFEIHMILKIIKYLAQQGYGTDKLVILTPYLGQLSKLRDILKKDNDPVLNDLDSHELVRAGLINPAQAKLHKKPIRLATIDNYQGEESDIVVVSLTRSNPKGDIGFMFSPERLNVLLSRARNSLIMIGNANTFKKSKKGGELWRDLFDLLGNGKHIYQGFPVKCERHPDTKTILGQLEDFDELCPDGGCNLPCGTILPCLHHCPSKCHELSDHSKLKCMEMMTSKCSNGHPQAWPCNRGPPPECNNCERAKKLAKKQRQEELAAQERKDAEQKKHLDQMDKLNAEIEAEKRLQEAEHLKKQRANALLQKQFDLDFMRAAWNSASTGYNPASDNCGADPPETNAPALNSSTTDSTSSLFANSPFASPPASNSPSASVQPSAKPSLFDKFRGVVTSVIAPLTTLQPSTSTQPQSIGKPFKAIQKSESEIEWKRQKDVEGAQNDAIDAIMDMTGLESIKKQVLGIKAKIDTSARQGSSLNQESFNVVFLGNPGTGKTTIARHYAKFLSSTKVLPGSGFVETTGALLATKGVGKAEEILQGLISGGGGAIFVDEAYQLTSGHNPGGEAVLDFLLAEMENRVSTLVFILAGYNKEMEKFFEHNPGLKSRVPYQFHFADYKDEELMHMFEGLMKQTFKGRMRVKDGIQGLYGRVAIRRLGRRRGTPGFGNARDLRILFSKIKERQAVRLTKERKDGLRVDDFLMLKEDLIGPDPTVTLKSSKAWEDLQGLIGLKTVKESVASFFELIEENYKRELLEKEPMNMSLNRVFLGSPGTGKTTVASLYGQILADIGLLSNGEVVLKNPSDFVGAVIGASEANTKAILANAVGKVLIIDEAYMLYGGGGKNSDSGGGNSSNQYKTSVIDTIVAEVQNVPGEDRCVLLLGYTDQMIEMFQNVNPGLSRRFKIEDAFNFEDFSEAELLQILNLKLKKQELDATDEAKTVAMELLGRMRNRPNFGNAGEVENIITQAKSRSVARRAKIPPLERTDDIVFEPVDFDPDHNRGAEATANLVKLFSDVVGMDDIVERLKGYQEIAFNCKKRDKDPRNLIPMNFVFTGPPGTGKTTVARKIGQVFYDMGILGTAEVVECSSSDMVGQYVGQTGPKTKKLFEKALGKVLFIDEAYRLAEGHFAQEAIDELVGLLTHASFKSKLIVVLAGYEQDMNRLLSVNTGLSSRFPDQVVFRNMDAERCIIVLKAELQKEGVSVIGFDDASSPVYIDIKELIRDIAELKDWGNARDMMTLSKEMIGCALRSSNSTAGGALEISGEEAIDVVKKMLQDRQRRMNITSNLNRHRSRIPNLPQQSFTPTPPTPPSTSTAENAATAQPPPPPPPPATQEPPQMPAPHLQSPRGRGQNPARGSRDRNRNNRNGPAHTRDSSDNSGAARQPQVDVRPPQSPALLGQGQNTARGGHHRNNRNGPARTGDGSNNSGAARQPQGNTQPPPSPGPSTQPSTQPVRDPGVSDGVWRQMEAAKRAAAQIERDARNNLRNLERELAERRKQEDAERQRIQDLQRAEAQARDAAHRAELQRQREEARLKEVAARAAREKAAAELRARQEAERQRKEREARAQQKLRQLGVCPVGFQWIKMGSIYRCAGGTHVVAESQLGL